MSEEKSWQEELNDKRVKTRGWYGCIAPNGWKLIVLKADEMLSFIDPDYEICQVKQKYGTLRYYFQTSKEGIEAEIMYAIERWAEQMSAMTCESCGRYGETRNNSWVQTLCDSCFEGKLEGSDVKA